ncbi:MAG TPA: A/G-specific adenine glycosylase, partial [bacterium]|nr:A/G-specific adenine glycosylase [bacterium]
MARSTPDKTNPLLFQKPLLQWYDRNKRDLPWRGIHDPYATFVSEMMLQQTQVKTVIPYYHRFLKELPDWKSLAKAKEEKVLKLWEGLGYYRRARNLQAAAQKVVQEFGGKLPDTMDEITKLPGVGPYSAGAVLSIAFQKPHPVVDGNVIRVFSRLFLLRGNLKTGEGHQKVWELAHDLIPQDRPGDFNQAVMELGATLCFSDNPQCLLCPLLSQCQASQKGVQNELPEMPKAQETVEIQMAAFLIRKKDRVLVKKRSQEEKWLKGMWEFPSAEGKTFEEARAKLDKELKTKSGDRPSLEVRHQITHHKVRLRLFPSPPPKGP